MTDHFELEEQTAEPGEGLLPELPEEAYPAGAVSLDPAPADRPKRIKASNPPKSAPFVNHRVKATRPVAE